MTYIKLRKVFYLPFLNELKNFRRARLSIFFGSEIFPVNCKHLFGTTLRHFKVQHDTIFASRKGKALRKESAPRRRIPVSLALR
jgi:hypothetical protein